MKVSICFIVRKLSLLTILFFAVACHKGYITPDGLSDEVYAVTFEIKDFEHVTRPVGQKSAVRRNQVHTIAANGAGISSQLYEGYLYYWSFNNESLVPDIAIQSGALIRYNDGQIPDDFANGWAYDGYQAGQSVSIRGLQELTIGIPLELAVSLSKFGFDISSSGTGPKAFDLYHSLDGENWIEQQLDNQFSNTNTAQAKNAFAFEDVDQIHVEELGFLWFRIVPKAGERGTAGDYNPTVGVTRIDNIRLSGMGLPPDNTEIDKLHYYVFDAHTGNLVTENDMDFDLAHPAVSLELPHGNYKISFVRNKADRPLNFPNSVPQASSYYFSNSFSNRNAAIFADEIELFVNENKQESIALDRYYSQVKFEFTDSRDLSLVKRLVITPLHDPFFYAPFNPTMASPVVDQSDIDVEPDFSLSKEFVFNQFMGRSLTAQPISYRIDAYDETDELLHKFDVSASIRNNVQLVFRGELLGGVSFTTGFQIQINEDWDGDEAVEF